MQDVFVRKPYEFVPPMTGSFFPRIVRDLELYRPTLRKEEGVYECEIRHVERLRDAIDRGDSVLVAPNHSRTADPLVMGLLAKEARCLFHAMASWHLFHTTWFRRFAIRLMGGFSVNREGLDRKAVDMAVTALEDAKRPLLVFPEGTATRVNDRVFPLLDGVAFIARTAAKKRKKRDGGRVLIMPVAIKYFLQDELAQAVEPVLTEIEKRLTWRPQTDKPLLLRVREIGEAILSLKEMEYLGRVHDELNLPARQELMIAHLLEPLEQEYLGAAQSGGVVARIKAIRMQVIPDLIRGELDPTEEQRRWRQVEDTYLAQQVFCYPVDYLAERSSVDRILETVERFEEDLNDKSRVLGRLKVVIEIGEPLVVTSQRDRSLKSDPMMDDLKSRLQTMLDHLGAESKMFTPPTANG